MNKQSLKTGKRPYFSLYFSLPIFPGANFGSVFLRHLPADKAFEEWMKTAKARNLSNIKEIVNALPITDPSVIGGRNRGSSNLSSEQKKCKE